MKIGTVRDKLSRLTKIEVMKFYKNKSVSWPEIEQF